MVKLLTVKDLCPYLGCGKDRAYELMHSKSFPSIKIGHRYYVPENKLEEWTENYVYKEFKL